MARPSIESLLTEKVTKYIEEAAALPLGKMPLSALAVANAIGHDRRVLKKYGLDIVIADAAKKKAKAEKNGQDEKRRSLEERIAAEKHESERLVSQTNALLAQLALVEGNAKRLGIDPEELYKPLVPPDRRVSGVFKSKGRRPSGSR